MSDAVSPVIACAIGVAVAALTVRARLLSITGAVAAAVLGALTLVAGWGWSLLLLAFFVPAAALSRWRARDKGQRTASVTGAEGPRRARQVLANGAVFGLAVAAHLFRPDDAHWVAIAIGALATAAADTWATEVGTAIGGRPWSLRTLRPIAPGLSGGVTVTGTLALVTGAAWIGTSAWALGFDGQTAHVGIVAGVVGAVTDSLLGATIQERRWCPRCEAPTERRVHACGTASLPAGGLPWMSNDAVNLVSTAIGGLTAALLRG